VKNVKRPAYYDEFDELDMRGELDEIVRRCKEIRDELSRHPNDTYPENAKILECLARAHSDNGDWCADAIETETALRLHRDHTNLPTADIVRCLSNLACAYVITGRPAEAEEHLGEAMMLLDHLPEREQHGRGFVYIDLAHLEVKYGDIQTAEQLYLRAARPLVRHIWWCNRHLSNVFCSLAEIYLRQGRLFAADRAMGKAEKFGRWSSEEDAVHFAYLLSRRGLFLKQRDRLDEARAAQTEALEILQRVRKPGHYLIERVRFRLAHIADA
jgi:tetratricopeptide (TPR) repeat protein